LSAIDALTADQRRQVRRARAPAHASLMKAVLTGVRFSDPAWIFERKLDGIRCLAVRDGRSLRLLSRNDLPMNSRYQELVGPLTSQRCTRFAIDGEVVAFDRRGNTSFARLAQRGQRPVAVFFYVFDLLWLDGHDVRGLPLRARKRLLRDALAFKDGIRLVPHRNADGEAFFREACRKRWEGLIAKRADSPYVATRSRDWLKFKCEHGQELVIGGFTAPRGSRTEFGALLVGYYADSSKLVYAGKVGTGFDLETLRDLGRKLRALRRDAPPFADAGEIRERAVTWVQPELVAELGFTEWTAHGRLRHPRFLGLRDDKPAREVVRES
jgi:bifunctional non-homologous end joining protein LigD